jgi:hypothetical protein
MPFTMVLNGDIFAVEVEVTQVACIFLLKTLATYWVDESSEL